MHKNEYLEIQRDLDKTIEDLKRKKVETTEEYINTNREFLPGEKIKITTPRHPYWSLNGSNSKEPTGYIEERVDYGYVVSNSVDRLGRVIPELVKIKKDGTPSKVKLYYSPDYSVKPKIERA